MKPTSRITRLELERHLVLRASEDESFRRELLRDPKPAIERELQILLSTDVKLRDAVTVRVHEEQVDTFELVLPPCRYTDATGQDGLTYLWQDTLVPSD